MNVCGRYGCLYLNKVYLSQQGDSKGFWWYTNSELNTCFRLKQENGTQIKDVTKKAHLLNNILPEYCPGKTQIVCPFWPGDTLDNPQYTSKLHQLWQKLKTLKLAKSEGSNGLHRSVLLETASTISRWKTTYWDV